jgi:hypothetical protein
MPENDPRLIVGDVLSAIYGAALLNPYDAADRVLGALADGDFCLADDRLRLLLKWHREETAETGFCAAHFESRDCCLDALDDELAFDRIAERRNEALAPD